MILASLLILTFATAFTWAQHSALKARMAKICKDRGLYE